MMNYSSITEEYYSKYIELQEKLRKSEEERLQLEIKFNEMVAASKEENQSHYRKLREKYKRFLEEDRKRQDRNTKIVRALERIEARLASMRAKAERFKLLRQQYHDLLGRVYQMKGSKVQLDTSKLESEPKPSGAKLLDDYIKNLSSNKLQDLLNKEKNLREELLEDPIEKYKSVLNSSGALPKYGLMSDPQTKYQKSRYDDYSKYFYDHNDEIKPNYTNAYADDIMQSIYSRTQKKDSENINNQKLDRSRDNGSESDDESSGRFDLRPKENILTDSTQKEENLIQDVPQNLDRAKRSLEDLDSTSMNVSTFSNLDATINIKEKEESFVQNESDSEKSVESVKSLKKPEEKKTNNLEKVATEEEELKKNENMKLSQKIEAVTGNLQNTSENNQPNSQGVAELDQNQDQSNDAQMMQSDSKDSADDQQFYQNQYDENEQPINNQIYDQNAQQSHYDENSQSYAQYDEEPISQFEENRQPLQQYEESGELNQLTQSNENDRLSGLEQQLPQQANEQVNPKHWEGTDGYDSEIPQGLEENLESSQHDENALPSQKYDESGQLISQYGEEAQQNLSFDGNGQYDENAQPMTQYDENGQLLPQYDANAQLIPQYDENGQVILQYDENGQLILQYDENGQPIQQYDENGQPIQQYDENGQPIQQYDENGQPIQQYDENGQPIQQYDENGQPIQQYDENGQPIQQYDENAQYYNQQQYDENGQFIPQYDENGQLIQQYDADGQYFEQYDENGQPINYQYSEAGEVVQDVQNEGIEQKIELSSEDTPLVQESFQSEETKDELKPEIGRIDKSKVMDMLDTDTDSIKLDTKTSNDSDFDFSNG